MCYSGRTGCKYLHVPTGGKLLGTRLQLAHERLDIPVDVGLVGPDVSTLRERLSTHGTLIRPLASVGADVSLKDLVSHVLVQTCQSKHLPEGYRAGKTSCHNQDAYIPIISSQFPGIEWYRGS